MSRADFYILNGKTDAPRFSCNIANKAWTSGNSVFIITRNEAEAGDIDDLLWTYQDVSFVPHAKVDTGASDAPILIGWNGTETPQADVMINLTDTIPECYTNYDRVIEIIPEDPVLKNQGRERYKRYRELGFELFNHTINTD
jgi:DNA polymerase-3 subunit chi